MKPPSPDPDVSRTEAEHYQMKEHRCLEKNILTQPMANLETFGDYIFGGKNKVQTFISWSFGWVSYPFLRRLSDPTHFQWKEIKKKITSWWVSVTERGSTPLKVNMLPPEKLTNPKRKDRFTTINFFKGYLKLQGGTILNQHEATGPQLNRQH